MISWIRLENLYNDLLQKSYWTAKKALVSRLISVDLDVPPAGLEPAPHSLRVYCSTN